MRASRVGSGLVGSRAKVAPPTGGVREITDVQMVCFDRSSLQLDILTFTMT